MARCGHSTAAISMLRRSSRRLSCVTRISAVYGGCWTIDRPCRLNSISGTDRTLKGATSYNTIAEITGSDKKDEVIMLGGHLDSWHSATGATDNAIGCAVMMEAARILKALGVKPRRTIRVALWSGEEQGLLGSQAYVKKHFGSFENPQPGYEKFGGYFNIDSGTGRARGLFDIRPARGGDYPERISCAVCGSGCGRGDRDAQPRVWAARTTRRSTRPACRESALTRTRSSISIRLGIPTWIHTKGSFPKM